MDELLYAVLCLIKLGSLVYRFPSVAQHAVDEPREIGRHGLGRQRALFAGQQLSNQPEHLNGEQ
jgi:hypothetical protein